MKSLIVLCGLLLSTAAHAGSITFQIVQGGFANANRTYTLSDAEIARIIVAYQRDANVSVNGTATRAQVLNYWMQQFIQGTISKVQSAETVPVAPPTPINPQ